MSGLTILICGRLYDGIHDKLQENKRIFIRNGKIEEITESTEVPEDAQVIDLSGVTVTPGMIDAHVHMDYRDWHQIRQEVYHTSEEMKTLAVLKCAQKALSHGFTSVRHMGNINAVGYGVIDVRNAINEGMFAGARIICAPMSLCTPGSHGDASQSYAGNFRAASLLQAMKPVCGSGSDFFVNAVREQVKYGADFIKIMATGGFFTPNDTPLQKQMNDAELEAVIRTAHELGTTVTAHVYAPDMMRTMLEMGIDGCEHGSLMDEETAQLFVDKGAYLVPTFCPYDEAVHYDPEKLKDKQPEFRAKLELYKDRLIAGRKVIVGSKIKLGYGTDFVANHQNYDSGWEYDAWMRSGMKPFRILKAATKTNAEILGIDAFTGTIEKGKNADISGWRRDLLNDSKALLDCAFVMKDGIVYPTEASSDL
ncbi:MAG: amidohydrolase family protein [Erysipelotrichaceae bacterium]|nr:amidohydrolase family protein [Erysipelotrichaceae bacterium]